MAGKFDFHRIGRICVIALAGLGLVRMLDLAVLPWATTLADQSIRDLVKTPHLQRVTFWMNNNEGAKFQVDIALVPTNITPEVLRWSGQTNEVR